MPDSWEDWIENKAKVLNALVAFFTVWLVCTRAYQVFKKKCCKTKLKINLKDHLNRVDIKQLVDQGDPPDADDYV